MQEMLSKRYVANRIFCKQIVILLGTVLGILAITETLDAALKGSPHDVTTGQCHLCHLQITKEGKIPSWNTMQMLVTDVSFSSQSHDMHERDYPQGISILCLSCHDAKTTDSAKSSRASFLPQVSLIPPFVTLI